MPVSSPSVFPEKLLRSFAERILQAGGLNAEHSSAVAVNLVDSDLLGHRTHGLAKLSQYVQMLKKGDIAVEGRIETIADHQASIAWDAHRLAGAWVMKRCLTEILERIPTSPVVTATIANCSHVGCLQVYLGSVSGQGYLSQIMASDPAVMTVAPFGWLDGVLGPNPIAMGIPTSDDPILIDQCTSAVSNSEVRMVAAAGHQLRGQWLLDDKGQATPDPKVMSSGRRGTIMPLGGQDLGYKGVGFGLMVEALALALSGYGRSGRDKHAGGQGVFIQVINPAFFAGASSFKREIDAVVGRIQSSRPRPGQTAPRLPGQRAQSTYRRQVKEGIALDSMLLGELNQLATAVDVEPLAVEFI
jgi:LDH2 family malate/lactate/ureidoglycolate dehydrogenase